MKWICMGLKEVGEKKKNICRMKRQKSSADKKVSTGRRALAAAAAVIAAGMLSGCSGGEDVAVRASEKEKIHLNFMGFKTGSDKVAEIETMLDKYMDLHPDVVITYEGVVDDYNEILHNRIESGRADDIFMIHPSDLVAFEAEGWVGTKICDLTNEEFVSRYNETVKRLITVNEKIFCAPLCVSVIGLAGNMDLLQECGIQDMPRTYGEWLEDMETVKAKGYRPLAGYLGNDASPMFLMAGRSIAPYALEEKTLDGSESADQIFGKGITDISILMQQGYISRSMLLENRDSRSYKDVLEQVFAGGDTAFTVLPSWGTGAFLSGEPDFAYKMSGLPLGDTGCVAMMRASVPVSVSNESPNKEEALAFLDFLMDADNIEAYAAGQNSISPLKGAKTEDEMYKELLGLIEEGKALSDTSPNIPFNLVEALNTAAEQLAGETPVQEVIESFPNVKTQLE